MVGHFLIVGIKRVISKGFAITNQIAHFDDNWRATLNIPMVGRFFSELY